LSAGCFASFVLTATDRHWGVYDAKNCWLHGTSNTSKLLTRSVRCCRCCRRLSHRNRYVHL